MVRVLITDDDAELRALVRYFLERKGVEVDEVENGAEAVARIQNGHNYSAMVLDLLMPIQDGFTTLEQVRQIDRNIPVIVLSSLSQENNVLRALKMGATDFLRKPFSPDELYFRIRRFVPELLNAE